MLKYRYARGADDKTYDILMIEDATRRAGSPYRCFGCDAELIPNLPKTKRTKYFSHKFEQNCSRETYLHKLAKSVFVESYREALSNEQPFMFSYQRSTCCNAYEAELSLSCDGNELAEFDLTTVYKRIALESRIGDFIPDIVLQSEKHPPILIEMVVTHESSKQKIASGLKIIEISINSEEDVQPFREKYLCTTAYNVRTHGIKGRPRSGNICGGKCQKNADFFVVYHSGKARIISTTLSEIFNKRAIYQLFAPAIIQEGNRNDSYHRFVCNLRHYLFMGIAIKNCLLCKHQGIGKISGIWCRTKSEKISASDAITCRRYLPFSSMADAKAAEEENLSEHIEQSNQLVEQMLRAYRRVR